MIVSEVSTLSFFFVTLIVLQVISLANFIFQLSSDQISFLQSKAGSARQKIRYNCTNSFVLPEDRERSLQILLWNDVLIGPYPEERSPLFYSLIEDKCKVCYVV